MSEEMYSVEQVADRLGLHVRTVRGYIRAGRLKAVRIGKQYRIARADLDALTGRPAGRAGDRPAGPARGGVQHRADRRRSTGRPPTGWARSSWPSANAAGGRRGPAARPDRSTTRSAAA